MKSLRNGIRQKYGTGCFDVIVTTLEGLLYGESTRVRGVGYQADGAGNSTCYEGLSSTIHTRDYLITTGMETGGPSDDRGWEDGIILRHPSVDVR